MDRRAYLATGAGVVATALAGCAVQGGGGGKGPGDHDVGMTASRFVPGAVTVSRGETVVWKNTSSHAHTVTASEDEIPAEADFFASGDFDAQAAAEQGWIDGNGGAIYEGEVYEHTFEVPGEYPYYCIPHEASGMLGSVTVTPATAASPTNTE